MLYESSRKQRELPGQPNFDKKYAKYIHIGFSGLANSNMLSEFLREQMALPWQPNVGKN